MDIHKPKAAHNWREFAVEIGTIICGILIALGLEQAVDASRTHHEVTETREALKQEVASNAARDLASAAEARCELFGLDRYIEWAKGGVRPPVRPPFSPVVSAAVWEASRSSAVLHMPVKERLQFARYYDLVEVRRENVRMVANLALDRERLSRLHRLDAEQSKRLQEYASAARDRLPSAI